MDRRYNQSRFYNGTRASSGSNERGEALVRSHLARARKANADSQSYGGSVGGASSAGGGAAVSILNERGTDVKASRELFRQYGSGGELGARSTMAEVRGFRQATPGTSP
ncbi:MAG: hypothetical protein RLZZ515_432 [Cyanobacteriota bacterium]|jgi:hypothetical protein